MAYTAGPGLIGALLTGAALARSLAYAWRKPAIGVHHLEGHLLAPLLEPEPPPFPHVALLVSGGHTMLIEVQGIGQYQRARRNAGRRGGRGLRQGGEASGPAVPGRAGACEARRQRARPGSFGCRGRCSTGRGSSSASPGSRPRCYTPFAIRSSRTQRKADIAHAAQEAIVETLVAKALRALDETGLDVLVVSGGVSANRSLRERMAEAAGRQGASVSIPVSSSARTTRR